LLRVYELDFPFSAGALSVGRNWGRFRRRNHTAPDVGDCYDLWQSLIPYQLAVGIKKMLALIEASDFIRRSSSVVLQEEEVQFYQE
jgi:hypothetical protein